MLWRKLESDWWSEGWATELLETKLIRSVGSQPGSWVQRGLIMMPSLLTNQAYQGAEFRPTMTMLTAYFLCSSFIDNHLMLLCIVYQQNAQFTVHILSLNTSFWRDLIDATLWRPSKAKSLTNKMLTGPRQVAKECLEWWAFLLLQHYRYY